MHNQENDRQSPDLSQLSGLGLGIMIITHLATCQLLPHFPSVYVSNCVEYYYDIVTLLLCCNRNLNSKTSTEIIFPPFAVLKASLTFQLLACCFSEFKRNSIKAHLINISWLVYVMFCVNFAAAVLLHQLGII